MSDYKPGYFQTYPQAIKGILIGLVAAVVFIYWAVLMFQHPAGALRIYAGAGFITLGILATRSLKDFNKLGKGLVLLFVFSVGFLAVRSWWI